MSAAELDRGGVLDTAKLHREAIWRDIEREARHQAETELEARCRAPLTFGEHIAWVNCQLARTDSLSPLHRVGQPIKNTPYTTCGELIPPPVRWLPLSAGMIRTMPPCRFCEAEHARMEKQDAA